MIEMPIGDSADNGEADGGEGDLPPGYDPNTMSDVVSADEYGNATDWQKQRFQRYSRKNNELKAQLETERQERAMLAARLAVVETNVSKSTEKPAEGLAAYTDADLKSWKAKALKTQQAFLADPTNDDLKAAVAQINPEHLMAVDEELFERRARQVADKATSGLRGEWEAKSQQETFEKRIATKYGLDAVRKDTDLYRTAAAEFAAIMAERGTTSDPTGIATEWAFDRAKAKLSGNRDGRGGDTAIRRLAIEGAGRREAQSGNSIAALQAKGDWKSQGKAVDLQIEAALKSMYGG